MWFHDDQKNLKKKHNRMQRQLEVAAIFYDALFSSKFLIFFKFSVFKILIVMQAPIKRKNVLTL